jgi:hypothetical protein
MLTVTIIAALQPAMKWDCDNFKDKGCPEHYGCPTMHRASPAHFGMPSVHYYNWPVAV